MIDFKSRIYRLTRKIPRGKVATYGQLARMAGRPKSSRAVGYYMKVNPDAPNTPCHRVVASDGGLTGYSAQGGIAKKRKMLVDEGVLFCRGKVDLGKSLWQG